MKKTFNTPLVKIVMFSEESVRTEGTVAVSGKYAYDNAAEQMNAIQYITVQAQKSQKILQVRK